MAGGEFEVIDAELVQDGRVEVVDMDFAGDCAVAHVVGLAIGEAAFDSAAGHPGAEAFGLVFASVLLDRRGAAEILAPWGAAKFTAPHDERVFEQAARFQILEQGGDRLIGLRTQLGQVAADIAVVIPAAHRHLHKAHAGLAEFARKQTGAGVPVGVLAVHAVKFSRGFAFLRDVHDLRRGGLHAEGEFEVLDHAFHVRFAVEFADEAAVHALDQSDALALHVVAGGDVPQILDGRCLVGERDSERGALMNRGEKSGAIFAHAAGLDRDEAGQVLIFCAEAVADPRAHGRTHFGKGAGVELQRRSEVLRVVGIHAAQQADVVGHACEMRHEIGNRHAGLSARLHRGHGAECEILLGADLRDFFAQW